MANNPTLLAMPIAENGTKNVIPATQVTAGDGLLSQSTGFPAETSLPLGAGGKAPQREDFNGALYLLSNLAFYNQKGWFFQFDANQAYFEGCVVRDTTDGQLYEAIDDVAAGGSVPSADNTNWKKFFPVGKVIGEIFSYAGTTQPPGALLCNGAAVSRTMYPDLFDEIGTIYGAGDGSTTFNLPQLTNASTVDGYTKTKYESEGSYTFTAPKSGTYKITVKGGGGGGQGGGIGTTSGHGGGGGGEGGTTIGFEKMTAGQTASVVIGAGGTGGTAATTDGSDGGNGGNSTVTINGITLTGSGGYGGSGSIGLGGTGSINGAPGTQGTSVYSGVALGGSGGGAGGGHSISSGVPTKATQGGGGAGGRAGYGSSGIGYAGGAGGDGYCWIEFVGTSERWYIQAFTDSTDPALVDLTQILQDLANKLTREQTPAFNKRDVVTVSGTYTAPVTGWYRITAKGGGAGGGGGTVASSYASGSVGGGEGGTTIGWEHLDAGDQVTVVVGAGGAGGAAGALGSNGGNTTATANNNSYVGGGGQSSGIGGSGTIHGAPGAYGFMTNGSTVLCAGGAGGGAGGGKYGTSVFNSAQNGINGGGGGSGGARISDSTAAAGGAGGDGYVWMEYFKAS